MEVSDKFVQDIISKRQLLKVGSEVNYTSMVKFLCARIQGLSSSSSPSIIAIIGGAAAGKSTLSQEIKNRCYPQSIIISTDDFVIGTRDYRNLHFDNVNPLAKYNFRLLRKKIEELINLRPKDQATLPIYDDSTGAALPVGNEIDIAPFKTREVDGPVTLIIIEGDFLPECKYDLLIYLHIPDAIRLQNRIRRDMDKRGYMDTAEIEKNFMIRQHKQHLPYTLPIAQKANLILYGKKRATESYFLFDIYQEEVINENEKKPV